MKNKEKRTSQTVAAWLVRFLYFDFVSWIACSLLLKYSDMIFSSFISIPLCRDCHIEIKK